jgi:AcrR family transcriptional regulator
MTKINKPYHHGDLPQALLAEAERAIEQDGIQELTLRGLARAVGVSHTAPQNHFGDLTGLLSELAAVGHHRLVAALGAAAADAAEGRERRLAIAKAYVGFARDHPGLFKLMFRSERLDATRPALSKAIQISRQALIEAVMSAQDAQQPEPSLKLAARATASWALVHGYAMLLLENRLRGTLAVLPINELEFFDHVVQSMRAV